MSSQQQQAGIHSDELSSSCGEDTVGYLSGITARLWAAILKRVPLGYEDETGFHVEAGPVSHQSAGDSDCRRGGAISLARPLQTEK
ncbi:MAG TPA: hypothetical protein VMH30_08825 [Verrucomicrobiae bacterium]|nr:hypothetical protein [Verrucomicrobiae bacterium]